MDDDDDEVRGKRVKDEEDETKALAAGDIALLWLCSWVLI